MDNNDINKNNNLFMRDGELPEDMLAAEKLAEAERLEKEAQELAKRYEEEGVSPENAEIIEGLLARLDKLEEEEAERRAQEEAEKKPDDHDLVLEIYKKTPRPDIMGRLWPLMIDTAIVYVFIAIVYFGLIPGTKFSIGGVFFLYLFCVYTNIAEAVLWIPLYFTNGYTLGKKLFGQRVVSLDGHEKLTFKEVFVRTFLIKFFCTVASYGMLNLASIVIGYLKPYSRVLHDVAGRTVTIQEKTRLSQAYDEPVSFN